MIKDYTLYEISVYLHLSVSFLYPSLSLTLSLFAELLFMRLKKFLIDLISNAINSHNMQQRDE